MDPISELRSALVDAAEALGDGRAGALKLERPPRPDFGDYSTNAAMLLAPGLGEPPRPVAERLGGIVGERLGAEVERVDVAGPGFLNLFMADDWYRDAVRAIVDAGEGFGGGLAEPAERVQVEFVSANPTGPITVASGRHAAYGDALSRVLGFHGHDVDREYYVNDAGTQVLRFGESITSRARGEEPPEDGYRGEYVVDLAARVPDAASLDPEAAALAGIELVLADIAHTLERFGVHMDKFAHERELQESGAVDRAMEQLEETDHTYVKDDALWLRTTTFGDDKDRVLRRSSGEYTYFAPDIAYHLAKWERGYDRVIDVWGADHHGYVARHKAACEALGIDPDRLELIIMQLVNLTEGGQRVQMSKRAGVIETLDALIEDIGVDAARWFLLQRSHDTTLDLDLELARSQSQENPVYYVQYAHARIASILRRDPEGGSEFEPLHPSEKALIKKLLEFPEEVATAAARRAPHRITVYALELAQDFTAFYRDCKVLGAPSEEFRLTLCRVSQRTIAKSLDLLGVSAPEEM